MKQRRPSFPIVAVAATAIAVVVATFLHPGALQTTGAVLAAVVSIAVTVEYLVLVPMSRNPGAKRLVGLLVAIDLLLLVSVLRYFLHNYPYRTEILTLLFWGLFAAMSYLGWHVWKDQIEGARAYRDKHKKKQPREESNDRDTIGR